MITQITITFNDGSQMLLQDDLLGVYIKLCKRRSNMLLPQQSTDVLAQNYLGMVKGFVAQEQIGQDGWERI